MNTQESASLCRKAKSHFFFYEGAGSVIQPRFGDTSKCNKIKTGQPSDSLNGDKHVITHAMKNYSFFPRSLLKTWEIRGENLCMWPFTLVALFTDICCNVTFIPGPFIPPSSPGGPTGVSQWPQSCCWSCSGGARWGV